MSTFDLKVTTRGHGAMPLELTFNGIARSEYAELFRFVSRKEVRIQNAIQPQAKTSTTKSGRRSNRVTNIDYAMQLGGDDNNEDVMDDGSQDEASEDEDFDLSEAEDDDDDEGDVDEDELDFGDEDIPGAKAKAKKKKEKSKGKAKAGGGKASKPRAKKAKKDPNAPVRNKNAYMLFVAKNRSNVKEAFPDMKMTDVGCLALLFFSCDSGLLVFSLLTLPHPPSHPLPPPPTTLPPLPTRRSPRSSAAAGRRWATARRRYTTRRPPRTRSVT